MNRSTTFAAFAATVALGVTGLSVPAQAQFRNTISNDLSKCHRGAGPAVMVTVDGVKSSAGRVRVQTYRGIKGDWLESGRWLSRVEAPARAGTMTFCLPVPRSGTYAVAVRHDVNGNGDTDIRTDGGAMSNNPSINIFNLGKPSYTKTAFEVGSGVKSIRVQMRYFGYGFSHRVLPPWRDPRRRARSTSASAPGAASSGCFSRNGVTSTGTPVCRSTFHAA